MITLPGGSEAGQNESVQPRASASVPSGSGIEGTPAPWLHVTVGVGTRILALNQDYDVIEGGARTVIFAPRRVQPHLAVGLRIGLR